MHLTDEPLNDDGSSQPELLDRRAELGVLAVDRVSITGNDHLSVLFPLTYASAVYEQPDALVALLAQAPKGTWIDAPYNGSIRWVYDVETVAVEDEVRRFEDCGVTEDPNPARDVLRCLQEGDTALHLAVRLGADEVVAVLLRAGASRHAVNEAGETPFDIAMGMTEPNPLFWKLLSCAEMFAQRPRKLRTFLTAWLDASWRPDRPFVRIDVAWNRVCSPPSHSAYRYH